MCKSQTNQSTVYPEGTRVSKIALWPATASWTPLLSQNHEPVKEPGACLECLLTITQRIQSYNTQARAKSWSCRWMGSVSQVWLCQSASIPFAHSNICMTVGKELSDKRVVLARLQPSLFQYHNQCPWERWTCCCRLMFVLTHST